MTNFIEITKFVNTFTLKSSFTIFLENYFEIDYNLKFNDCDLNIDNKNNLCSKKNKLILETLNNKHTIYFTPNKKIQISNISNIDSLNKLLNKIENIFMAKNNFGDMIFPKKNLSDIKIKNCDISLQLKFKKDISYFINFYKNTKNKVTIDQNANYFSMKILPKTIIIIFKNNGKININSSDIEFVINLVIFINNLNSISQCNNHI